MSVHTINAVRSGFYLDSVALMRMSVELRSVEGVDEAVLMIGTETNKTIMRDASLLTVVGESAGSGDLVIAVAAQSEEACDAALLKAESVLAARNAATSEHQDYAPRTLSGALDSGIEANLALISTPGQFAVREARLSLERGLNVMVFSDNIPVEDEVMLKRLARERGLLMMGPDCGTAYLNGTPIAFANAVRHGSVGVVSASGTGLQEVAVLLDRAGYGLSHGIGVGGRDLSDAVGGISTLAALDLLDRDPSTQNVIVISKPPGQETLGRITERLRSMQKPVKVCFLGDEGVHVGVETAATLEGVVELTLGTEPLSERSVTGNPTPGRILGLFTGGTLCAEAQVVMRAEGIACHSNVPVGADAGPQAAAHLFDLGSDEYTQGRPHPMLEPAVRESHFDKALSDPDVAVILLDVVLGFGAHREPAQTLVECLSRRAAEHEATVIAYVLGTDGDPQVRTRQEAFLKAAGVTLAKTNADAARLAASLVNEQPVSG